MANSGAKKRKVQNEKELLKIRLIIGASSIPYILYRVMYHKETFVGWNWFAYISIAALNWFAYYVINSMCKLTYDNEGELIDAGADLNQGGLTEYYFDIIYLCSIIQALGMISDKFLLLILVIPIYAIYKLGSYILPWLKNRNGGAQQAAAGDEKSKRREKMEKKQDKPKVKFTRG